MRRCPWLPAGADTRGGGEESAGWWVVAGGTAPPTSLVVVEVLTAEALLFQSVPDWEAGGSSGLRRLGALQGVHFGLKVADLRHRRTRSFKIKTHTLEP